MARKERLLPVTALAAGAVLVLAAAGCNGSGNTVTGPPGGTASVNVAGAWSGSFQSDDPNACGNSTAIATFQQVGNEVTGNLQTSNCGVGGYFKATLTGDTLMGSVSMTGCVGGDLSGTANASTLTISISDLTKPLITGDRSIMAGGVVTLRR